MKTFYLVLVLLISIPSSSQKEKESTEIDRLVSYLSGKFDSSRQAQNFDEFENIQLVIVPIWESKDEHWLYVEQTLASKPQKPLRQRIYKISRLDEKIIGQVYELDDSEKFIGKWENPSFFDQISNQDIELREGCSINLKREGRGAYKGSIKAQECSSDLIGTSYSTSIIEINPEALSFRSQGYDESTGQVSKTQSIAYNFIKVESFE